VPNDLADFRCRREKFPPRGGETLCYRSRKIIRDLKHSSRSGRRNEKSRNF